MIVNLNELDADTSGWSETCVGYHTVMVPPGLSVTQHPATMMDWNHPTILRAYPGAARDAIMQDEGFADIVYEAAVNGWTFVAARKRTSRLVVSSRMLIFFGAQKVGDDVVMFKQSVSLSRIGDPSEPRHVEIYRNMSVLPDSPENRAKGFCFDGFVFAGYRPRLEAVANVSLTARSQLDPNVHDRHGLNVALTYRMQDQEDDPRPLAPQASVEALSDIIKVEEVGLRKNAQDGIFSKASGVDDQADRHAFRAIIYEQAGQLDAPTIYIDTLEDVGPMTLYDGQKEFLTFLAALRANAR